ncbi:MAG: glycoside hydrolase family 3 C-terminal domain-containing protein [Calditrichaceae bacterium]|nr:glycoside hydrolase family 3 C-terminal domain-containing protein [Calditrichaceae bacterium]MBN2708398.1 glycoside hydrolase family 3 C-terminal domain-containing protein [Calditrichaceae bacterium]
MRKIGVFILVIFIISYAQSQRIEPRYLDVNLSLEERVNDLVSRMTLEEKINQMIDQAEAIPRLNIPEYNWWNECLHGVARAGTATVFPQAIGLAATWNTNLMFEIADVISTEARAKHHEYMRKNDRSRYKGLTFWSPNINIFRDPRWGRGQETYGEDPYLTARMGVAFVKGLQGDDPKYFKVIATPKHYAVHSGPEPERHIFDAITGNHDLYDTYLPAFEACVKEAGAYSIMCAYNRYMGEACCGSAALLHHILREDWGFDGYIVSDCGAIYDIYENHKIVETAAQAAALAVKSGTDLNCGKIYKSALAEAIEKGLISEDEINTAVKRLFTARFKLGLFDPDSLVKYTKIPIEVNDSEKHRALSVKAARESMVLLKNENNILPLKKNLKRIAVIGPTADSYPMLLGNYNGTPSRYVTPLQGIINKVGGHTEIVYEHGCNLVEEGPVKTYLSSEILSIDNDQGLKAEFFKNRDLSGEPFYHKIDPINNSNWIYGTRVPNLWMMQDYSIRWSGMFKAPETGLFNFTVKGDGGYRFYLNDQLLVDDWQSKELSSADGHMRLEKNKEYPIVIEYCRGTGRPEFSIQWELSEIDNFKKALEIAEKSDAIIFIGGITAQLEGEEMPVDYEGFRGGDRTNIDLPKVQQNLIKLLHGTGKPVILVLSGGSALAVNWEKQHIPAIVYMWYPGQEGGTALADILFGDYNPAGRLPVTFYKSVEQLPPFEDYNMKGRTYRYFDKEPLFPFGYGLSYTKFLYSNLICPDSVTTGDSITVSVEVTNTGKFSGDEVIQLYLKDIESSMPVPICALKGFTRIHLDAGEKRTARFVLTPKQMAVIQTDDDKNARYIIEPGIIEIALGGELPGSNSSTTESVTKRINLIGKSASVY